MALALDGQRDLPLPIEIATDTPTSPDEQYQQQGAHIGINPPSKNRFLVAYLALAVAVVAMSSGGVWFALLTGTPPILKACWRLTLTAFVQCSGLTYQWRTADEHVRATLWKAMPLMFISGVSLGMHFASWSWSIDHTSLTHSLLFVSSTPLCIVAWLGARYGIALLVRPGQALRPGGQAEDLSFGDRLTAFLRRSFDPAVVLPPTGMETAGAVVGFLGATVLIVAAGEGRGTSTGTVEPSVSVQGDAAAFLGAVTVWAYLEIGSKLRKGGDALPLFLYATPVTAIGAFTCAVGSALLEESFHFNGVAADSLFGWMGSPSRFGVNLAAAVGSGILGHTAANFSLQSLNPLLVSVALLWEPLFGSLMGYAAGVSGVPGVATLAAGPLLLLGALLTTLGSRDNGIKVADCWARMQPAHFRAQQLQ